MSYYVTTTNPLEMSNDEYSMFLVELTKSDLTLNGENLKNCTIRQVDKLFSDCFEVDEYRIGYGIHFNGKWNDDELVPIIKKACAVANSWMGFVGEDGSQWRITDEGEGYGVTVYEGQLFSDDLIETYIKNYVNEELSYKEILTNYRLFLKDNGFPSV